MKLTKAAMLTLSCSALTLLGHTATVLGQTDPPEEFSLILLDRTGSMSIVPDPGQPTITRWVNAIDAAKANVQADEGDNSVRRAYAIWDFRLGAGTSDPTQNGARLVWPTAGSDCTGLCVDCVTVEIAPSNLFCMVPANRTDAYDALKLILESYKTDPNRTPDPNYMGRTPLAQALCEVLSQIQAVGTTVKQTITFESDGLENQSILGDCGNYQVESTAPDFVDNPSFAWQTSVLDWGMSSPVGSGMPDALDSTIVPGGGSWEARVVRRSLHLTTPSPGDATSIPIQPEETAATNLAWRVGVHYELYPSTVLAPATAARAGENSDATSRMFVASAAEAASAGVAAAATSVSMTIPQTELSLFRLLGSGNFPSKGDGAARSSFQSITYTPGQVYGVDHAVAGDVNDSGCVCRIDLNVMMLDGVWMQRAVAPSTPPGPGECRPLDDLCDWKCMGWPHHHCGMGHKPWCAKHHGHGHDHDKQCARGGHEESGPACHDGHDNGNHCGWGCEHGGHGKGRPFGKCHGHRGCHPKPLSDACLAEVAIHADLNRDGWVNEADRAILLTNWGNGCTRPVGPVPTF